MPTTAEYLQRLVNAKTSIANAITAKGGTVNSGDGYEEFSADIGSIPTGSTIQTDGIVVRLAEEIQHTTFVIPFYLMFIPIDNTIAPPYTGLALITSNDSQANGIYGTSYTAYPTIPLSNFISTNQTITVYGQPRNSSTYYTMTWVLDVANDKIDITQSTSTYDKTAAWIGSKPIILAT